MRGASFSLLTILCLMLAVVPAAAYPILYSNGPPNFTTDAWTINSGFSVTDSFSISCCGLNNFILDLHYGVWLFPGDSVSSVQMDIGRSSFGTDVFSGVVATASFYDQGFNQYGYDVGIVNVNFGAIAVSNGTYWLTLSNAVSHYGFPIYWDENSGPSTAYENSLGSIPSEAFTVTGLPCSGCACGSSPSCVPEPSSIMLFGSGILGLAGILRRRLRI